MENLNINVITFGVFFLVLLLTGGVLLVMNLMSSPEKQTKRRISRFRQRFAPTKASRGDASRSILLEQKSTALEELIRGLIPRPALLRERFKKTGRDISLTQYMAANVLITLIGTLVFLVMFSMPAALSILLGLLMGIALPHVAVTRMIKDRLKKFTELFPESIDLIVRGLKSGLPITESIANVGREIGDPVGIEFRTVADNIRIGKTLDEALWSTAKRLDTPDFKFFVISIAVQQETGGNLAESLGNLGDILRKRQQMKLKIKAMSSEGKASAMIVGALPFIMFGMLLFINYDYASILFTDTRAIMVALGGLTWMSLGIFIMSRMINFEI